MHFDNKEDAKIFSAVQAKRKLDSRNLNKDYDDVLTMSEETAYEIIAILDRTGVTVDNGFVEHMTRLMNYHDGRMEWSEREHNMRYVFTSNPFGEIGKINAYPIEDRYAKEADYDNCFIVEKEIEELLEEKRALGL